MKKKEIGEKKILDIKLELCDALGNSSTLLRVNELEMDQVLNLDEKGSEPVCDSNSILRSSDILDEDADLVETDGLLASPLAKLLGPHPNGRIRN